jgi:hypothetical protein
MTSPRCKPWWLIELIKQKKEEPVDQRPWRKRPKVTKKGKKK